MKVLEYTTIPLWARTVVLQKVACCNKAVEKKTIPQTNKGRETDDRKSLKLQKKKWEVVLATGKGSMMFPSSSNSTQKLGLNITGSGQSHKRIRE